MKDSHFFQECPSSQLKIYKPKLLMKTSDNLRSECKREESRSSNAWMMLNEVQETIIRRIC